MTTSLVDLVQDGMTSGGIVDRTAAALGIAPEAATRGLTAAGTTMLAGLASRAKDPMALTDVVDMVKDPAIESAAIDNPMRLLSDDFESTRVRSLANRHISTLFGFRADDLIAGLARYTGVGKGATISLLAVATPLFMRKIGALVRGEGLNAAGLGRLLLAQQPEITAAVPAPLAGMFLERPIPTVPMEAHGRADEGRKGLWWLLPAALIPLALLAVWLLRDRRAADTTEKADVSLISATRVQFAEPVTAPAARPAAPELRAIQVPEAGVELNVAPNGVESRLLGFVRDEAATPNEKSWFEFDRLTFDTDSATLEPGSNDQLDNVAVILKAFPDVKVKIGGYTDDTGEHENNMMLSQSRADTVRQALVDRGIASDRIEAEGYAESHPLASNTTEEGRAKNRRIAIRVTEK